MRTPACHRQRVVIALGALFLGFVLPVKNGVTAPAAGDAQKARDLYHQGSVFFDTGQFGKAVEVWQRAYEVKQDPTFLYDIGQAYRLAGDPRKALFFYKSFLRNGPRNSQVRNDAEQKVAALQKQIAAEDRSRSGVAVPPGTASPIGEPKAVAPLPQPPLSGAAVLSSEPPTHQPPGGPPPAEAASAPLGAPPPIPEPEPGRVTGDTGGGSSGRDELLERVARIDFGLAPGVAIWVAGPVGGEQTAFAATALAGFTFGEDDREARLRFRLGVVFQYATLGEPGTKDTFIDLLIDPTLRVRAWEQRLYVSADVGLGALALAGLKPSSVFLAHNENVTLAGTQYLFEIRPAVTAAFRLYPAVELFAGPAVSMNPHRAHFHESMIRVELLGGVALRF
jgi:hypothetical protein